MGWRGIMFLDGDVWLDYNGTLIGVNYQSQFEKKKQAELITAEKKALHESLRSFKRPVCILVTSTYRIRIDDMGNDRYRYASWKLNQRMSCKPDVVVQNGELKPDGSGGNCSYIFTSGNYVYECEIIELGENNSPPAYLTISKGGNEIVNQKARISK